MNCGALLPHYSVLQHNLRAHGSGIIFASDHSVFHTGINDLLQKLGLQRCEVFLIGCERVDAVPLPSSTKSPQFHFFLPIWVQVFVSHARGRSDECDTDLGQRFHKWTLSCWAVHSTAKVAKSEAVANRCTQTQRSHSHDIHIHLVRQHQCHSIKHFNHFLLVIGYLAPQQGRFSRSTPSQAKSLQNIVLPQHQCPTRAHLEQLWTELGAFGPEIATITLAVEGTCCDELRTQLQLFLAVLCE